MILKGKIMGFVAACLEFQNQLVVIDPVHGWGWSIVDASQNIPKLSCSGMPVIYDAFDPRQYGKFKSAPFRSPSYFHCQIIRFFQFQNELRGAVARVQEEGHCLEGQWLVFYTRNVGEFNFTDQQGHCNVEIGVNPPVGEWPMFTVGQKIHFGYGLVADSKASIKARHIQERRGCQCLICQPTSIKN